MKDLEGLADRLTMAQAATPRDAAECAVLLEQAIAAFDSDPRQAAEIFDLAELYDELWLEYESLGRVEEALTAADAAVAAGLRSEPDPRCLRAEILMRAGRVGEAEPIWAAVRADTPDDVWLYNNAGLEYAAAGQHETAVEWLTVGLRLAIESRDPERLVDQLADLRRTSLAALGRDEDDLQHRAAEFLAAANSPAPFRFPASAWPAATQDSGPEPFEPEPADWRPAAGPVQRIGWAWFPAGEYDRALATWPDLAEEGPAAGPTGVRTHAEYCREMEGRLREAAAAGLSRILIAPLRVTEFTAWCCEREEEPGSAARAAYAAELVQRGDPSQVPWPPGRNDPCWCGSGRKYKKCCGAPR